MGECYTEVKADGEHPCLFDVMIIKTGELGSCMSTKLEDFLPS